MTVAAFAVATVLLLFLYVWPFVRLGGIAFSRDGAATLENISVLALGGSDFRALLNSLFVGVSVTIIAVAVATVLAYLLARTDLPGARFLSWIFVTPYFIPPFISAFAWTRLLGPVGYYNRFLMWALNLDRAPISIYGAGGVIAVSAIYTFPFAFLILRKAMVNMDASLEESARVSGATPFRSAMDITVPTLLPSIGAAAVIVFVTTVSMFGIPAILGVPGRFVVLTTRIYAYVGSFGNPWGLHIAAGLSLVLLVIGAVGLWLQQYFIRHEKFVTVSGKSSQAPPVRLGPLRWPLYAALVIVAALGVVAPIAAVLLTALTRALGLPLSFENLTFDHFGRIVTAMPVVERSVRNSLLLGVSIATLSSAAALVVIFVRRYGRTAFRRRIARLVDFVASVPYAVPGMVIGIAIIVTWIRPVLGLRLYNTWWILAVAYLIRFMIFPMRSVDAALRSVDGTLVEAARLSGATAAQSGRDILLPIVKPSVLSGWMLVFMPALTELTLSILLYSPGNETIGVTAYNIMQEGLLPVASALSIVIIAMVLVVDLLTRRVIERRRT